MDDPVALALAIIARRKSIFEPSKPYTPKHLVSGFCIPTNEGSGEHLVCSWCASIQPLTARVIPVTFDGLVKCFVCRAVLP